jgi:hypothetical protein
MKLPKNHIHPRFVITEINRQGLVYGDIVYRQGILETGWFTSPACTVHRNLFGLRSEGKIIQFDFWEQSITYYKNHIQCHWTGQNYYDFLECMWRKSNGDCQRYAMSPDYIQKLKNINYLDYQKILLSNEKIH